MYIAEKRFGLEFYSFFARENSYCAQEQDGFSFFSPVFQIIVVMQLLFT